MKRIIPVLSALVVVLAGISLPATASPETGGVNNDSSLLDGASSLAWLEDAPEYPVQPGGSFSELSSADMAALVEFEMSFPWKEAYGSFGCEVSHLKFSDNGGKSMLLDCANASIPLDQVAEIRSTAIAAAEGRPSALAALKAGSVVDTQAPSSDIYSTKAAAPPTTTKCSIENNNRHCLGLNYEYNRAASLINTISGTSTGKNRLGHVGGGSCSNGSLMDESVTLTISPSTISFVDAFNMVNSQFSSRWSVNLFSWTRFCTWI